MSPPRRSPRLAPLALALVLACSSVQVSTDYDPEVDFGSYRTYAWLPRTPEATGHPRLDSPLVQERVRRGIDRALAAKGFQPGGEASDFFVTYQLAVDHKLDAYTTYREYYGLYGYRVAIPETTVREYDEGSLIVDVMDAKRQKVVWRGVASGRLRGAGAAQDPAELQKRVYAVVDEVLAGFPPRRE